MRVVLDANVVVSALFGGTPRRAVERALREEVCLSPEILAEFEGLKGRLRRKLKPPALRYWTETYLPSILGRMHLVEVTPRLRLCRDPKDDAYLSLASAVEARYLVTGDEDLLALANADLARAGGGLQELEIVTPRGFPEEIEP